MFRPSPLWVLALALALLVCPVLMAQGDAPADATPAANQPADAGGGGAAAGAQYEFSIIDAGGTIGYFIMFLSVITLMLIAFHLILLRRSKMCPASLLETVEPLLREKKVSEAAEAVRDQPSLLGRMIGGGLSRVGGGYAEMEEIMSGVAEDEAMRLEQGVGYFGLLAAIAPLCGLLGTVVGMIFAFNEIATRGVVTPAQLAAPIQKALVTTCFGLVVAIPNVVAYTFFRNRLHVMLADLGLLVEDLMTPFRVGEAAANPGPGAAATAPYDPEDFPRKPDAAAEEGRKPIDPDVPTRPLTAEEQAAAGEDEEREAEE